MAGDLAVSSTSGTDGFDSQFYLFVFVRCHVTGYKTCSKAPNNIVY